MACSKNFFPSDNCPSVVKDTSSTPSVDIHELMKDLNIRFDESHPNQSVMVLKQIALQSRELLTISKKESPERMTRDMVVIVCDLAIELLRILSQKHLLQEWRRLDDMPPRDDYNVCFSTLMVRMDKLANDLREFYKIYESLSRMLIDALECLKLEDNRLISEGFTEYKIVNYFCLHAEEVYESMQELEKRMHSLKDLLQPPKHGIVKKDDPLEDARVLQKECGIIFEKFLTNTATDIDVAHLRRLNRRMYLIARDSNFVDVTELDTKQLSVIKGINRFDIYFSLMRFLLSEEELEHVSVLEIRLNDINDSIEELRSDTMKACFECQQKCFSHEKHFQILTSKQKFSNPNLWEDPKFVETINDHFAGMVKQFQSFYYRVVTIRNRIRKLWDAQVDEEDKCQLSH
ncbi:PREDICTED: uncharacterized protein LOC108558557 [Nicrophorus vespilloides]|uniref:Uncharacterized protein LOC108558557 n=1 Tax=Nicrophorus vespilloides TaxID=110193 RepID=A0ABM1M8W1_NICVS|nr:PREDICTED: uncharacterized protein LOC108558557 [Nicrophorus vespilloides]